MGKFLSQQDYDNRKALDSAADLLIVAQSKIILALTLTKRRLESIFLALLLHRGGQERDIVAFPKNVTHQGEGGC